MHAQHQPIGNHPETTARTARLAVWTLAWAATLALARFGPSSLWESRAVSWAVVAANLVVGIGWIIAHARYLRAIDELQRKIVQDALAITLGAGWVGGFAYVVADSADLIAHDVNLGIFPALLGVVYVAATVAGTLRYR